MSQSLEEKAIDFLAFFSSKENWREYYESILHSEFLLEYSPSLLNINTVGTVYRTRDEFLNMTVPHHRQAFNSQYEVLKKLSDGDQVMLYFNWNLQTKGTYENIGLKKIVPKSFQIKSLYILEFKDGLIYKLTTLIDTFQLVVEMADQLLPQLQNRGFQNYLKILKEKGYLED